MITLAMVDEAFRQYTYTPEYRELHLLLWGYYPGQRPWPEPRTFS